MTANVAWENHLNDIRNLTRIADLVCEYGGERPGRNDVCKCPFHNDTKPSMSIDNEKGFYNCFALGCDAQGDIFMFVMDAYSMSFRDSVDYLADRCGLPRFSEKKARDFTQRPPKPRAPQAAKTFPERFDHPLPLVPAPPSIVWPQPGQKLTMFNHKKGEMKKYSPDRVDLYKTIDQSTVAMVMRLHFSNGSKWYIPARFGELPEAAPNEAVLGHVGNRRMGWIMEGYPKGAHAPLYGEHRAPEWLDSADAAKATVLVVEGEKTADAAIRAFGDDAKDVLVLTPMGGGSAPGRADWRRVLPFIDAMANKAKSAGTFLQFAVWPDADALVTRPDGSTVDPRVKFTKHILYGVMNDMQGLALDHTKLDFRKISAPKDVRPKWDLADLHEINWTGQDALNWMNKAAVRLVIQQLPKETLHSEPVEQTEPSVSSAMGM